MGDYQISWAFYARLAPANAPQYYAIEGRAGDRLTANLEVPKIAGLENFRPALAVIGPGLPAFDAPRGLIVPEGYGGMLVNDSGATPRAQFDEPFSQTSYYRGPQLDVQLPQTDDTTSWYWIKRAGPANTLWRSAHARFSAAAIRIGRRNCGPFSMMRDKTRHRNRRQPRRGRCRCPSSCRCGTNLSAVSILTCGVTPNAPCVPPDPTGAWVRQVRGLCDNQRDSSLRSE